MFQRNFAYKLKMVGIHTKNPQDCVANNLQEPL